MKKVYVAINSISIADLFIYLNTIIKVMRIPADKESICIFSKKKEERKIRRSLTISISSI